MTILIDQPLRGLHTMGCSSNASQYAEAVSEEGLRNLLVEAAASDVPVFILGGGSNTVFSGQVEYLVIRLLLKGVVVESESASDVLLRVQAGENWHEFVRWTLEHQFYGLENLSLIPGTVGAAPIQNIGAYGVEVKSAIREVVAIHKKTAETRVFTAGECQFEYRNSVFKQSAKDWVIVNVLFGLSKAAALNLSYQELRLVWEKTGRPSNPNEVGRLVESLRQQKLPDPEEIPNSGSFFKNPTVSGETYHQLLEKFPKLVAFPNGINCWKLAAGWLIQECGWKGYSADGVGVYHKQALVLVNPGHRPGEAVCRLAENIQQSVMNKFGVSLEIEPVIL